jgi:hypothetical protein
MSNKIEFYQSPEELPVKRYQRFQKFVMIDSEVGSTFQDFDERSLKVIELLRKKMIGDAVKELENKRQAAFNAYEEYSPKHFALALMVKSINGVDYTGKYYLTEEGLNEIIDKLEEIGYSEKQLVNDLDVVKKKLPEFWKFITQSILVRTTKQILMSCFYAVFRRNLIT